MTKIMIVVMMEKMIIGINHIFNNYSNVGSDENCLLLCHNILVVITEIIDVSNADDVNDEDDDDDRLTWIPNINYNLDDDDNTFQTC